MTEPLNHILIVDDDPAIRRLFEAVLKKDGKFEIRTADSGTAAIELVQTWQPNLVLLDLMMPGMDGLKTCRILKKQPFGDRLQIVMVTARSSDEEMQEAFDAGAGDYLIKPIDPVELSSRVELHFRYLASQQQTQSLQNQVQGFHQELHRATVERTQSIIAAQDIAVFTLAKLAESRDNETGEHLIRLRSYAQCLAKDLQHQSPYHQQIDSRFLQDLYRSSPLHDIGKVGIADDILLKPGKLTADEFETMKQHTIIGANILNEAVLQSQSGDFLAMAAVIALSHHEKWNGFGYPSGLIEEEIPLPARIIAVADVFDALTSERPYKKAWPAERARACILEGKAEHFDPIVVESFERCFEEFCRIRAKHQDRKGTVTGALAFQAASLKQSLGLAATPS